MKWFKHFSNASTSLKLNAFMDEFGVKGYGHYWLLLELLADNFDGTNTNITLHYAELSSKTRIRSKSQLQVTLISLQSHSLLTFKSSGSFYDFEIPILRELQDKHSKYNRSKRLKSDPKNIDIELDKEEELINISSKKNLPEISPQDFRNSKDSLVKADQLQNLFNKTLAGKFGKISHCHGLSGDDLRELLTTLSFSSFQKIETWNEIFSKVSRSEFLNGSKGDFVATLNWLCKHKNALNVLNGQYSGTPNEQKGGKKAKSSITPDNPTGDPYLAELKEIRKNGETA